MKALQFSEVHLGGIFLIQIDPEENSQTKKNQCGGDEDLEKILFHDSVTRPFHSVARDDIYTLWQEFVRVQYEVYNVMLSIHN